MSWPFIITVALLVGLVIGQFGYGTGIMLIAVAVLLWAGDALKFWINTGQVVFLIAIFSSTGIVAIGTHLVSAAIQRYSTARSSGSGSS
jgi:hypothetical protein